MAYASYADSINDIRCGLEHVAGFSSKPAELDTSAALTVIASAERLLCQMRAALEVATDPSLEVAGEVVRLRAHAAEQEKQRSVDLERIKRLSRDADRRAQETTHWRDEFLKLSRRTWTTRRRRPARRRS